MLEYLSLHKQRQNPILGVFVMFLLAIVLLVFFQSPLAYVINQLSNNSNTDGLSLLSNPELINLNFSLILFTFPFIGITIAIYLTLKYVHKSNFLTIFSSKNTIDYKRIGFGFLLWGTLQLGLFIVDYFFITGPSLFQYHGFSTNFFIAIFVSILFFFVQTSAEEFLCRGYLLQALGNITKYRWLPILISGLFFGFIHIANQEIDVYGTEIMLLHYCSVGIFLGIIVVLDNRIELAIGFHAVNNTLASLLVNFEGASVKGYSLFSIGEVDPYSGYIVWLLSAILYFIVCKRKYKWESVSYIFKQISNTTVKINEDVR